MTDESILYIFKFPKVCILIVAFISTKLIRLLCIVVKDVSKPSVSWLSYYGEVFFVLPFWLYKNVFFCKIEGLIILMEDL